eukprot:1157390-Pelagomonas_calceolata.AAC.1
MVLAYGTGQFYTYVARAGVPHRHICCTAGVLHRHIVAKAGVLHRLVCRTGRCVARAGVSHTHPALINGILAHEPEAGSTERGIYVRTPAGEGKQAPSAHANNACHQGVLQGCQSLIAVGANRNDVLRVHDITTREGAKSAVANGTKHVDKCARTCGKPGLNPTPDCRLQLPTFKHRTQGFNYPRVPTRPSCRPAVRSTKHDEASCKRACIGEHECLIPLPCDAYTSGLRESILRRYEAHSWMHGQLDVALAMQHLRLRAQNMSHFRTFLVNPVAATLAFARRQRGGATQEHMPAAPTPHNPTPL